MSDACSTSFQASKEVTDELDKSVRNFLWNGSSCRPYNHLVNWGKTSLPLQYGIGLCVKKKILPSSSSGDKEATWRKVISSIYDENPQDWRTLPPNDRSKDRLCFDIARIMVSFFHFLDFKANHGVKSKSGKIDA